MINRRSTLAACALLGMLLAGCSKEGGSAEKPGPAASGPVTDAASTGLKDDGGNVKEAAPTKGDADAGKLVFTANCAGCHGANGAGGGVGPNLHGEKSRKDFTAAVAWIKNPAPPMPKLYPSPLGEKDVANVAAYVESL